MEVLTPRLGIHHPVQASTPAASSSGPAPQLAPRGRLRKVARMLSVYHKFSSHQPAPVLRQRQLVADLCRLIAGQLGQPLGRGRGMAGHSMAGHSMAGPSLALIDQPGLSGRMRQTLQGLLAGEGEKQIAYRLKLSPHTVHVYVKGIYRHFGVSSRGELLARFVRPDGGAN